MKFLSKVFFGVLGINITPNVTDPIISGTSDGDIWYSSALSRFRKRESGAILNLDAPKGRARTNKGATVSSASNLTLGDDGNVFHISGTTTIDAITYTGWGTGDVVVLIFDKPLTVKHNSSGGSGSVSKIYLKSTGNLTTATNTTLHLVFDGIGSYWYEI